MLKNLLILPDGTEISSGPGTVNAIQSTKLTQSVNSGEEMTLGSACAAILEMTLFTPGGNLQLNAGDRVTLYKVSEDGNRTKIGVFILEQPTRPSANTVSITGYDPVIMLDKDLTQWLGSLAGWPYKLIDFASMVCEACGLHMVTEEIPNGDFFVPQFTRSGVTGRLLMQWIGEASCRFCRADADGNIRLDWYEDSGKTLTPADYYARGFSYCTYQVEPVEAVQLKLAQGENGGLWPEAAEGANSYIIEDNPIFHTRITEDLLPYLQNIGNILGQASYTPCQVALPADLAVGAGSIVDVMDANGKVITAYVMTKVSTGQRDTLECTGSRRRDSASAMNNKSPQQIAQERVDAQTREDIFNKLTDNGKIQGLYVQDGKWYINAELAQIVNLVAERLLSELEESALSVDGAKLQFFHQGKETVCLENDQKWYPRLAFMSYDDKGNLTEYSQFRPNGIELGNPVIQELGHTASLGASPSSVILRLGDGVLLRSENGKAYLTINGGELELSWRDNGDETYSIVGSGGIV